ncbi:MAG TPA: peptide transporter, partial [Verrucomicrobiae bacterium]|nr:peptide transporter [Verrucomicrobiae bacterium]
LEGAEKWQSAMTVKFVGALKGITTSQPHIMKALQLGILIGLAIEVVRKSIKKLPGYKQFAANTKLGRVTDFLIDAVILASPYASSFGGFVEWPTVVWWTLGGVGASVFDWFQARRAPKPGAEALPSDMGTMSLVGGGLIAGDSLAALSVGILKLLRTLL